MTKRMLGLAGALIPLATLLSSCEETPCKPTKMEARDAAVADLSRPLGSAVLEAHLTTGGRALGSRTIRFVVDDSGREIGQATTGARGIARLDLKRTPTRLVDPVRGGSYRAIFARDFEYCGSVDAAKFRLVK